MVSRFLQLWKATLAAVLDLFIPPVCLVCHSHRDGKEGVLCKDCAENLATLDSGFCPKCGTPMPEVYCEACAQVPFCFDFSRSVFRYSEEMKLLIHELKYNRKPGVARYLADRMARYLETHPEFSGFDSIAAVPLHTVRMRERGFNQSELIARRIAKTLNLEYINAVQRSRYTSSQTRLHREQRLKNLSGAFRLKPKTAGLSGRSIIVIDDIFTTGSTINEVARILKTAGADRTAGLTAARA
jgi:ComF family protein